MVASFRLPDELAQFMGRDPSRSLLIRGEAGTGKTTLALTLLTAFPGNRVYISNRVPLAELEQDYAWLRTENAGIHVIQGTKASDRVREMARSIEQSGKLVDLRRDHEIAEELWLPDAVTDAYSQVPENERGMIVIDSWDALVERYVGPSTVGQGHLPDRAEIERILVGLMERSRVQLVLVAERDVSSQLDYLVDGVVSCTTQYDEGRLERWVHLKKLRGVRITHSSYPFSLDGARFQCIAPLLGIARPVLMPPEPDPEPTPGFLWPGSAQFAEDFGRLPIGRATLIETDLDVPAEAVVLFLTPIFSQVASQQGRALHILPPRASPESVLHAYRALYSPEEFVDRVRIFSPLRAPAKGTNAAILDRVLLPVISPVSEDTSPRMTEGIRFLAEGATQGRPNLVAVWLTGLQHASVGAPNPYTRANVPVIVERVLETGNLHAVMVGPSTDPFTEGLREMASIRIQMRVKHGRVFVYGLAPRTPPLVLAGGDGSVPYDLIPIV
jgi:KaiC/GvpD/RAD55 family RecA-like ATPase